MMILRAPEKNEHADLSDLCIRSKAYWGYDAKFMDQCREELTISPDDITATNFQVAESGGVAIGVARVDLCEDDAELDLLYVDPDHMGAGAGRRLFDWALALAQARSLGAERLTIVADPHAEAFYRYLGAIRIGEYPSGSIPGRMLPHQLAIDLTE